MFPCRGMDMSGKKREGSEGFILLFVMLLLLGVSALAVAMIHNAKQAQVTATNHKNRIRAFYASDGMRALLDQEILDGNARRYQDTGATGEIDGDVFDGTGGGLAALRAAMAGPPSSRSVSDYLGSQWKDKENYGVRWRGYLDPPTTGNYTFFLRADAQGAFYLSSDASPANLPASPTAWSDAPSFAWPASGSAVSAKINLKENRRYYFEFLHTKGSGSGFGQVGWNGPEYLVERPIPGKRLSRAGGSETPWDTAQLKGAKVRYSVEEAGSLIYRVRTEAIMGGPNDTSYRAPLNHTLSLRDRRAPPDSIWQRVIFYDFRANKSNPEFERKPDWGPVLGVHKGMVREKGLKMTTENASWFGLDSIGKPVLAKPAYNCGIDKWFSPWKSGWHRTYAYAGGEDDCTESPAPNDRAFENVVLMDSLAFRRRADLGANAYQFRRFSVPMAPHPGFTPIDGRGFGSEGRTDLAGTPHNYGFCMELHAEFEHTSGLYFEFNGDDDVWLYIADSLVIDLGFVHPSLTTSLNLDDLPLKFGATYPLDFFYCERQSTGSSIDLITNLPMTRGSGNPRTNWKREYGETD